MDNEKQKLQIKDLMKDKARYVKPAFHKINTVDNLFSVFFGFQSGMLLVEVIMGKFTKEIRQPFVEIVVGKHKQKTQSSSKESREPKWGEEFMFDVNEANEINLCLSFVVCKKNKLTGKPKLCGGIDIPLKDLIDGRIHEKWWPLHSTSKKVEGNVTIGELYLKLQYHSEVDRNSYYIIAKENKSMLMTILLHHDIVILSTLCRVYESDELSKTLIRLFHAEGQALRLLMQLIYRDLKLTSAEDTLFRIDSMATKTARNYLKMVASDYLRNTLVNLIVEVIMNPKGYEIDPKHLQHLPSEELQPTIAANLQRLQNQCQIFLDAIIDSVNDLPMNIRKFFNLLRQLVGQCFPSKELKCVGSILFLRFLCPAVIAPAAFGVISEDIEDEEARRALTLIAKVLQNLANELLDFKEDYMKPLNPFLSQNVSRVNQFFDLVSTIPATAPNDASRAKFTEEDRLKCLSLIVGVLIKNIDMVEKKMKDDPRMRDTHTTSQNWDHFLAIKKVLTQQLSNSKQNDTSANSKNTS
mmetsp:Transcript_20990/g.29449  ORF Transcript_20990/g.29449 Transcript_20990/m.29449 type:complete len:525 (-) Transcript_20990:103-1677(-)